ncbi:hypothetical protein JTE90_012110 [Oedothorax gibbosus]|uniref:Prokineticin domain-containing protein n=1 Tax=Oedothorax gibbosus TaxID=931172 RepID=A0AAV6UVA8_9ARAC|nr:hypothetical protein JTE90_012110 [Oedothorax gibbosus]
MKGLMVYSVFGLLASVALSYQPRECSSARDCGPNACCRIGMQRYALPECSPLGDIGDPCRMGAEPEERTLFYPNQIFRYIEDSYALFCPCRPTLTCTRNVCSEPQLSDVAIEEAREEEALEEYME